jgi:hypothetical protein
MQKHVIRFPERLRFNEVDSVLRFVALALLRIEFELHRFFVSASTSKRRLLLQRMTNLDTEKSGCRRKPDIVAGAELLDEMGSRVI